MGWRIVDGYSTFREGSSAFMILTPSNNQPVSINPCFVYGVTSPTPSPSQIPTGSIINPPTTSSQSSPSSLKYYLNHHPLLHHKLS